ncbi:MAG: hypothetical protein H7202_10185 [Pedobacter sp.]|nr:hypothetical protein [Pedobacter sp.]
MKKFILSLAIIATSFGAFAMQTPAAVKKSEVKTEKKAAPKAKKEVKKEVKEVKKTTPKKG